MGKRTVAILLFLFLASCAGKTPPSPPVIVSTHGPYQTTECNTIIDTTTGLEWKIGPDQATSFEAAREWVKKLRACKGRCCGKTWRLPTDEELVFLNSNPGKGAPMTVLSQFKELAGGDIWVLWSDQKEGTLAGRILSSTRISGGSNTGTRIGVALLPGQSALKRPAAVRPILSPLLHD